MYRLPLPPITDGADWVFEFQLWDVDYNEPILLDAYEIQLALYWGRRYGDDYGAPYRGNGTVFARGSTTGGEITIQDTTATWIIRAGDLTNMAPGVLNLGGVISFDGLTSQLFLGTLPVIGGYAP